MASELEASGTAALVIGPGGPAAARRVRRLLRLPFPVLADPERRAYAAWGLGRGLAGLIQTSATALVDKEGSVRYLRAGLNPSASMEAEELRARLAELA